MLVEISTELLVQMFRTDNLIRSVVLDGIPPNHWIESVTVNEEHRTIELLLHGMDDKGDEPKAITLRDLRGT